MEPDPWVIYYAYLMHKYIADAMRNNVDTLAFQFGAGGRQA